jgi:hypothetical protein
MLVVVAALSCACAATAEVDVRLARDGSGTVAVTMAVDDEAKERIGDLSTAVKTDDLTARGWTVSAPVTTGRTTSMTATKPFSSPAALAQVMEEISGGSKLLDQWSARVTDGFASTTWSVTGTVAATGDLAQFSDDSLAAALDGLPLGRTPQELAGWGQAVVARHLQGPSPRRHHPGQAGRRGGRSCEHRGDQRRGVRARRRAVAVVRYRRSRNSGGRGHAAARPSRVRPVMS